MRRLMTIFAAAAIACSASVLPAGAADDQRIISVDLDKVFNEFYKTKLADAQLKEQAEEFKEERKTLVTNFKAMQDEFNSARDEAQNTGLSEDVRNQKRAEAEEKLVEIREQESKIRRFDESRQKQLDEQSRRMRKRLIDEISEVVQTYARQQGFSTVIDSSGDSLNGVSIVVYNDPRNDITDAVVELLNKGKTSEPTPEAAP